MNYISSFEPIISLISIKYQEIADTLNISTEQLDFVALAISVAILLSRFISKRVADLEADRLADKHRIEKRELLLQARNFSREELTDEEDLINPELSTVLKPVVEEDKLNLDSLLSKADLKPERNRDSLKTPDSLKTGLTTSRKGFFSAIKSLFGTREKLSQEMVEELEMMLVSSDLGVTTVGAILSDLKSLLKEHKEITQEEVIAILKAQVTEIMNQGDAYSYEINLTEDHKPHVLMIVGVNGVGKTTTIAKLANNFIKQNKKVIIVAGDTFRAAAVEQIKVWGERLDVQIVSGNENAKPSAVVFDAMVKAKEEDADLLIVDTAGRLHTKTNLMQELEGIKNIMHKHDPAAPHDVFLVVDGTTGQNGLIQAKEFNEVAGLTGIVVTKLDGTSKGGIVVAIKKELGVPVRYIGVGEGLDDLLVFNPKSFSEALLSQEEQTVELSEHGAVRRRKRDNLVS